MYISPVNGQKTESRTHFAELYGKISQLGATFDIDVVIQRHLVSIPIKPAQIPPGYEVVTGCKYHVGVMYRVNQASSIHNAGLLATPKKTSSK